MHFIERDAQGQIVRVEASAFPQATEQRTQTTPEIEEWFKKEALRAATLQQLQQSDLEMVRVLEDLIEVLMRKGLLSITDLPPTAQSKLISRAKARRTLGTLDDLIAEDEPLI